MKDLIFRSIAGVAGVYHVGLGLAGLVLPRDLMMAVVKLVLGVSPTLTSEFGLMAKYTGAYLLVFGVMMLMLAINPKKYRNLLGLALLLFGIRFVNKIFLFENIEMTFEMTVWNNLFGIVSLGVIFGGLLLTRPWVKAKK